MCGGGPAFETVDCQRHPILPVVGMRSISNPITLERGNIQGGLCRTTKGNRARYLPYPSTGGRTMFGFQYKAWRIQCSGKQRRERRCLRPETARPASARLSSLNAAHVAESIAESQKFLIVNDRPCDDLRRRRNITDGSIRLAGGARYAGGHIAMVVNRLITNLLQGRFGYRELPVRGDLGTTYEASSHEY